MASVHSQSDSHPGSKISALQMQCVAEPAAAAAAAAADQRTFTVRTRAALQAFIASRPLARAADGIAAEGAGAGAGAAGLAASAGAEADPDPEVADRAGARADDGASAANSARGIIRPEQELLRYPRRIPPTATQTPAAL